MAKTRTKSWIASEILTAADLNAEFNALLSSPMNLISPATAALDMDGYELILDADGDSSITIDTDDVLHMRLQAIDAFIFDGDVASSQNGLTFTTSAASDNVSMAVHGVGTNVGLSVTPKGTGEITLGKLLSGSWTPQTSFDGGTTGLTQSTETGTWIRIGNLVFVKILVVVSAKGSDTGFIRVSLPTTVGASDPSGILNVLYTSWASTATAVHARAEAGLTYARFYRGGTAGDSTLCTSSDVDSAFSYRITGWYESA